MGRLSTCRQVAPGYQCEHEHHSNRDHHGNRPDFLEATAQNERQNCEGKQAYSWVFGPVGGMGLVEQPEDPERGSQTQEKRPDVNAPAEHIG